MMSVFHQVALTLVPGIGNVLGRSLVCDLGGAEEVFKAKRRELTRIHGIGGRTAEAILRCSTFYRAEEELRFMERNKVSLFFFTDPLYPSRLKQCYDAPLLLYFKGTADLNSQRILSVVGTRSATVYGKELVNNLIDELKGFGVFVISGLAHGIDSRVHRACLTHGVTTAGVLGHGLDRIYPSQHRNIAEKMLENGGWISEFPSGTNPDRENFPKRNRIIAGMADATVVVEAGKKGGALITADLANSYDRDVYAYPGNVGNEYSAGCNMLIKTNRAHLVTGAEDISFMLGWNVAGKAAPVQVNLPLDLSTDELTLVGLLRETDERSIDELQILSGFTPPKLNAALLGLEIKALIRVLPGKSYRLTGR
jgi:DNA processing protein